MRWHEDFYVWGEVEKIRAMKFGADAEIYRDAALKRMAAKIGRPDKGCLLTHAAVDAFLKSQIPEHGLYAIRLAFKMFRDGWFWEDNEPERIVKPSLQLKGKEVMRINDLLRDYSMSKKELSEKRAEVARNGRKKTIDKLKNAQNEQNNGKASN